MMPPLAALATLATRGRVGVAAGSESRPLSENRHD